MRRVHRFLIPLFLFAALGVSLAATAAASAAECPDSEHGGDVALCKGKKETEGEFKVLSKKIAKTPSKLEVKEGPTIVCEEATNEGLLNAKDSSLKLEKLVISFSKNCKVTNTETTEKNCVVSEPIKTNAITGEFVGENPEKVLFKPSSGETFAEVTIKNNGEKVCAFKITAAKVTGTQEAKIPNATNEALTVHELKVEPAESKLKFAGKEAKLTLDEEFELSTKAAFGFQQS